MDDVANASPQIKGQLVDSVGIDPQQVVDDPCIRLDRKMLEVMRARLSLDDFGRLTIQIARAASAKRPSDLQRLLLTIMTHKGGEA